jgi:hypothetical protein
LSEALIDGHYLVFVCGVKKIYGWPDDVIVVHYLVLAVAGKSFYDWLDELNYASNGLSWI